MSLPDEKSRLRRQMKFVRSQVSEIERLEASKALTQRLQSFLCGVHIHSVGVYLATPLEISLDPLIEVLLNARVVVSAPRIDPSRNTMAFIRLQSLVDVGLGAWNLREPLSDEEIIPNVVLVPGLAFDARGHRLGMRAGWYDRTIIPAMTTVGVCYDWQILPCVPVESHDSSMKWVFSDQRQMEIPGSDDYE